MRAVILAGGKGTRLRPYSVALPKPLMPIGEYPILEVVVRQLVMHGFTHLTMAVNHMADLIQAFFGDGRKWGITIDYSLEHMPLSTMAPLKLIPDLPEDFLVMNGDILTDLAYGDFYREHVVKGRAFTIAAHHREVTIDFGVLEARGDRLVGFKEKPVTSFDVSMGIYMVNRRVLEVIPDGIPYGFDDLMLELLRRDQEVNLHRHERYWLDIGRPDDYQEAVDNFESMRETFMERHA